MSEVEAAARIEASVGPTHGVHATAKARPAMIGPPVPARRMSASGRHSWFRRGTNGVSRKKTPIAMMRMPATLSSVSLESRSVEPRPVAVMPSATNMMVNDRQKTMAGPEHVRERCGGPRGCR